MNLLGANYTDRNLWMNNPATLDSHEPRSFFRAPNQPFYQASPPPKVEVVPPSPRQRQQIQSSRTSTRAVQMSMEGSAENVLTLSRIPSLSAEALYIHTDLTYDRNSPTSYMRDSASPPDWPTRDSPVPSQVKCFACNCSDGFRLMPHSYYRWAQSIC
jgi:hypothetical protein